MEMVSAIPPVESLFDNDSTGVWQLESVVPKDQIEGRRKLRAELDVWDGSIGSASLYDALNSLLLAGNDRFVLYCPLGLIPQSSWYRKHNDSIDLFSELYLKSWERLLSEHDIRANFIDGDVPDSRRVVKASHLAPVLLEKGLISQGQVDSLMRSDDEVLRESIQEAFDPPEKMGPVLDYEGVDGKRREWLEKEQHRVELNRIGLDLGRRILDGSMYHGLTSMNGLIEEEMEEAVIIGIRSAVEHAADPQAVFKQCESVLLGLLERQYSAVSKAMCRLNSIGIVSKEKLNEWGVFIPNLSGPFYHNLPSLETERTQIRHILLEPDEYIFPVAIVFGSKLKGYGDKDSDVDLAVFVKPGVDVAKRAHVVKSLKQKFGQDVTTFWLTDDLEVHNFPEPEPQLGDKSNVHVLFGGAWEGDKSTIQMLGDKLLKPYFYSKNKNLRQVWLGEMERDFLQYRLLHRGYEAYHTPKTDDVFLDHGYRMIASKIYASRVFMPDANNI